MQRSTHESCNASKTTTRDRFVSHKMEKSTKDLRGTIEKPTNFMVHVLDMKWVQRSVHTELRKYQRSTSQGRNTPSLCEKMLPLFTKALDSLMNPHFTQLSIAMHLAQQINHNYPLLSQPIGKWLRLGIHGIYFYRKWHHSLNNTS